MATRIPDLDDYQRTVTLMVDEIHIKTFFDYKGSGITGVAHNLAEAANTALVVMLQSLTCKFKEVAHIVPVRGADTNFLHGLLKDVICELKKIDYKVISVVPNNNKVHGKAVEKFHNSVTCLGGIHPTFLSHINVRLRGNCSSL
ncbi:hypothetical protein HPB49_018029 [Dermacentor silvarum]|uniref:Uncharacterized protein n=1 Tax=Dermacentor silvarum TaxID=543639 RepID=A0ACB8DF63_DERSI|nr:hypothetical protein HPB49_018029 [Dermacentor silvarum]